MRQSRTVICGLARNIATHLPGTMARIERLGSMFADYRVLVYENDSTDATREYGAWVGLAACLGILIGAVRAMADEHTPREAAPTIDVTPLPPPQPGARPPENRLWGRRTPTR